MMKRIPLLIVSILCVAQCAHAFTLSGFDSPDSVVVDPDTGAYYVSNIVGGPTSKDGNGYISKITPNGNILIQKYIGGKSSGPTLDAPKGLQISGKLLYVTDIDVVKVFDMASARLVHVIDFAPLGASNIDDITMDSSGKIYVSDRASHQIFRVDPAKQYETMHFSSSSLLDEPTGLMINPRTKNPMIVTYSTGRILELDANGRVHILKRGLKGLSGIDHDVEGNLYVSSRDNNEVYKIPFYGRGTLSTYLGTLGGPSDVAFDKKRQELIVPSAMDHTVTTYPRNKEVRPVVSNLGKPQRTPQLLTAPKPAK